MKKILISTGGTGGHVFPATALIQQLKQERDDIEIIVAGGNLSQNKFLNDIDVECLDISCGSLNGNIFNKIAAAGKMTVGIKQSLKIIKEFKPDLVVGFGSFYTFPVVLAAKMKGIPLVLHEANSIPGRVTRGFSRFATATGVHLPQTLDLLKGNVIEVGMPLRGGYTKLFSSRDKATRYFRLDPEKFTFLVFGGSQGALALNTLFSNTVSEMSERSTNFQVIHFTGKLGACNEIQQFYDEIGIKACVKDFEEHMDQAWICADMTISRAGAMSIAEQLEYEVPGILIPYPYATDGHQDGNADFMVDVGSSIKIRQKDCTAEILSQKISELLANDKAELHQMCAAMKEYKQKLRRRDLCSVVCEIAGLKWR